jgi:hypothetical protein
MNINDIYGSGRGSIHTPEAYAQGKMLDHSKWNGQLPRNITPSDVDMVVNSGRCTMFIELSTSADNWPALSRGQGQLYSALVKSAPDLHLAALCYHETPVTKQIDTMNGLITCSLLISKKDGTMMWGHSINQQYQWPQIVCHFCHSPAKVIADLSREFSHRVTS